MKRKISIIVAIANGNAIGMDNGLLTYVPGDLKRFKEITTGHTVVMGRKTFQSLPKGALPNRRNIVLTRDLNFSREDCEIINDLESFVMTTSPEELVFCIGGGEIYKQFLPYANNLHITQVNKWFPGADTFFPDIDYTEWELVNESHNVSKEKCDFSFSFLDYKRIK